MYDESREYQPTTARLPRWEIEMFEKIFGDKPWYKSMTAWGLIALGAAEAAVQSGLLPAGVAIYVTYAGTAAVALGLRKAATAPNSG